MTSRTQRRILVVEDEPTIALGLRDDLEIEGYKVELATDGDSGAARAMRGRFDLILLDVMLPGKSGLTVCRELRAAGMRTPVILLTARGQEADKVAGLQLGADDYVTKPFSPAELMARIEAVLRRTDGSLAESVFRFDGVEVDFRRHQVIRDGCAVDLTAVEFKLLRTLIERRDEVLSLDRLFAEAWGPDVCLTDRVIYTHINNLRSKIEPDPRVPRYIISVRGVGYRFDG